MPLALDLISTLVMGSILPVATTLLARSPFSTFASFEGSILVPPLVAAYTPPAITRSTTAAMEPYIILLRRFDFLPFPLPFTNRLLHGIQNREYPLHLVLRHTRVNSSFELRLPEKLSGLLSIRPVSEEKESEDRKTPDGIP